MIGEKEHALFSFISICNWKGFSQITFISCARMGRPKAFLSNIQFFGKHGAKIVFMGNTNLGIFVDVLYTTSCQDGGSLFGIKRCYFCEFLVITFNESFESCCGLLKVITNEAYS